MTPTELEPTVPASEHPLGSAHSVMVHKNCLEHLHIAYTQYGVTVCTANQRNEAVVLKGRLPALGITLEYF